MDIAALQTFLALVRRTYGEGQRKSGVLDAELPQFMRLLDGLELPHHEPTRHGVSQGGAGQERADAQRPPGLRFWDDALRSADDAFAAPLTALHSDFRWTTFYGESDWSRPFLSDFAAGEIVGPGCAVPSDDLVVGVLLMGPRTFYPTHAHPAVEVYTALAGEPHFKAGDEAWRTLENGAFAFHPAHTPHATRTGARPMLALYAWRGDITAPSYYREAGRKIYPPKVQ